MTYVSQVEYVDAQHLALSFQFFNKTRRNVLANPGVELLVVHPQHGAMYRIAARYLRTETEGALFERMKAKLAGIASHTGMSGVFKLRGADLYAVDRVEQVAAPRTSRAGRRLNRLSALRRARCAWPAATDLDSLVERMLDARGARIRHPPRDAADARRRRAAPVHGGQPRLRRARAPARRSRSATA